MTLTDHDVIDIVEVLLRRDSVRPSAYLQQLRDHSAGAASLPALKPIVDRYLAIKDPPRTCQVEHAHWEGNMICGNTLPCTRHGGR